MLKPDFLDAVVTEKKLAGVVKDKHQSVFSYHTSEFLSVVKVRPCSLERWHLRCSELWILLLDDDRLWRFSKQTSARRPASFLTGFGNRCVFFQLVEKTNDML